MFRELGKADFEAVLRLAAVIPVLAFSLAIVHEASFFLALGRNLLPIYQASDFLALSIAYVVIAVIPALVGPLIDLLFRKKTLDQLSKEFRIVGIFRIFVYAISAFSLFVLLYVLFFGGRLAAGISATAALILCIALIFAGFNDGNARINALKFIVLTIFCAVIYSGANKGLELRYGDRAWQPRVFLIDSKGPMDYQYLVRIVGNGVVFLDRFGRINLVDRSTVSKITYQIDMTEWRGLICEIFGRCR